MGTSDWILSLCMGLGLSAASGLRVFIPLLSAGLAFRFQLVPSVDSSWLATTPALVTLGVAAVLEVAAYKIPFVDNVLDALGAPVALAAGGILASEFFLRDGNPALVTFLSLIAGAGTAGFVHGATSLARLASTKTTAGMANPVFSIVELIGAVLTSIASILIPLFAAALVALALSALAFFVITRGSRLKKAARGRRALSP